MKNKLYLLLLLFLVCILSISAISATENTTKDVIGTDNNKENNLETNIHDDVSTSKENCELNLEQNNNDNLKDTGVLKFSDLNTTINGNSNSTIYLSNDYTYDVDSDSDFKDGICINRNLTINGNGVTIDGSNKARIFKVDSSGVVFKNINFVNAKTKDNGGAILGGCTVIDCTFEGNSAKGNGGAIYVNDGNLYVEKCNFYDNSAYNGGAIYSGEDATCPVIESYFKGNKAHQGGAIYNGDVTNCIFEENGAVKVNDDDDGDGGAMCYGRAVNCTFTANYADDDCDGGALSRGYAENCTFTKNKADDNGGAIFNGHVVNCNFTDNSATNLGGAIYFRNGDCSVVNCYFNNNSAGGGGAISVKIEAFSIVNCTFISNSAWQGGAIYGDNIAFSVSNSYFNNNGARRGGALYNGSATNCKFEGNYVDSRDGDHDCNGGAIYHGNAYNSTFIRNHAEASSGAIHQNNASYNCTFIGNTASGDGGAVTSGTVFNCIFNQNSGLRGGALYWVDAFNCTFRDNDVDGDFGQAMFQGTAWLCTFNGDTTCESTIVPASLNVLNYTSNYNSGEKLKFHVTVDDKVYDGLRTTIKIYKNDDLVQISYGLTGDGWIVDLVPGEYSAVLSLTDHPDEKSSSTTIKVLDGTIYISPIGNVKVGQEVTINYTTKSNGAVTIKVNGEKINGTKFTPTKEGSYTVTVEVAENGYYKATSNETTFIIEKTTAEVLISPITDVVAGQEVTINYTTNSNGTVTIKVNGQKINGTKFTPTKEGVYNVTVEVVENDYYKAASNETIFTIEKTPVAVVISPIADVVVGQEVAIRYATNSNGTVTIKVNGEKISGTKFTPTKEGSYTVTVEVAENGDYRAASNEITFMVEKSTAEVVLSPIANVVVGQEVTVNYATNSNGTVTIKVNGEKINGTKFTPTKEGSYTVTVEVAENDYYKSASNQTTFKVEKLVSKIIVNPVSTTYNVGGYLIITLKDENGKPINSAPVTVNLEGSKNYETDSNGQIKINVATLTPKTYSATITFAGNKNYAQSTKSVKVTVNKATPKMTAKSKTFKKSVKTKKYVVTLKTNKNKVMKKVWVTLKVNKKTYKVKTNSKGKAIFKIKNLKKKAKVTAKVKFAGSKYYKAVTKKAKIIVK